MATQILLDVGSTTWTEVEESATEAITDLLSGSLGSATVAAVHSGHAIECMRRPDGEIRLTATGNDSLQGPHRLTVRDERAVLAVGFSASTANWGSFHWDWSAPVDPALVASGIARTMRDIYKSDPDDVALIVTL